MPNQYTHPWTSREIEFIRSNVGKLTYEYMGQLIGRSYSSIQSKVRYLPFKKKIKKHTVNSDFFKKWSSKMAYVLGLVATDGNICHSGNAHALHIASDDKDIIQKVRPAMDYRGPIYMKKRFNGKISYSLRICDKVIFNDLEKLGITERKSLTLVPPKVPNSFVKDFLRGFLDGDGTIYLRDIPYPSKLAVIFYTASPKMATYLYRVIREFTGDTYRGNIQIRRTAGRNPYYAIGLGHKASVKLCSFLYADASIYMDRKYKKFLEGVK